MIKQRDNVLTVKMMSNKEKKKVIRESATVRRSVELLIILTNRRMALQDRSVREC